MTPEAQNIAIAEVCGWEERLSTDDPTEPFGYWVNSAGAICPLPDYTADLNAICGAIDALPQAQYFEVGKRLKARFGPEHFNCGAEPRCEEYLKTIGKWEEGE